MANELTALEELLLAFQNLEYEDNALFDGEMLIEHEADKLISEHYAGFDSLCPDGREYINQKFRGDFEEAFNQVSVPKLK